MKTVVVVCVLIVALIGGAAAGKKEQEDTCRNQCLDVKKLKEPTCKQACSLNQKFKNTWIEALQCSLKCGKKHGLDDPATKPCAEICKKKYEDKVAEIAVSCAGVCTKEEKEPLGQEKCKKICFPSLIYKEMQEKNNKMAT